MGNKAFQISFGGQAVDDSFYADVLSLTVEENTSTAGAFHMQVATRLQDDGTWLYLGENWLDPFTAVSIQIGFVSGGGLAAALGSLLGGSSGDGMEAVFDGYVTDVQLQLSTQGKNVIDVSGMDTSLLMSVEEKIATWPNMADSDIATQIVSAYSGVTMQADTTATVHQDTDTTVVQRATDLQFVRDLAQRNGLEFYFQTDSTGTINAYFRAPQLSGTPQPDLAVHFGVTSNLRSFSAHLSGQRPVNVKSTQMDVSANSPNMVQVSSVSLAPLGATDSDTLIGSALDAAGVVPKDAQAQMLVLGTPTSDQTEMQTLAQAVRDEAAWFIKAEGEVNAEAYQTVLRPHALVLVKGAGTQFSGKYYVTRVVHEIKSEGSYTQRFGARRNARDVDGSEQFGGGSSGLAIPGI